MRRQWNLKRALSGVLVMALVLAVGLATGPAAAQDQETLIVWYTVDDIEPVMIQVSAEFAEVSGAAVDVHYVRPQQLYDSMAKASADGPDVILASSDDVGPLIDNNLVLTGSANPTFFLADVLDALPALIGGACPDIDVTECLWPRVSPTLSVVRPDESIMMRTENWLCRSADWLPMCSGDDWPGEPLSWWFNIYLISDSWLVEQGLYVPTDAAGIDDLRSEYGLDYEWAQEGSLPLAESADASTVYIFPSALLVQDPQGLMRSLGSFDQAGYVPVFEIGIDSLFISADSANSALAQEYIEFITATPQAKVDLMFEANLLPALDVAAMRALGQDAEGTQVMLRAVTTLTAYTGLAY